MLNIRKNVALAKYTTFRVGGIAKYFTAIKSLQDMVDCLKFAKENNLGFFLLGGGSNLVAASSVYPGLVALNKYTGLTHKKPGLIRVNSGTKLDYFCRYTCRTGLYGVECLSGIPGTVGGAVVQNAGAYGQEISDHLQGITVLDTKTLKIRKMSKKECLFSYRNSVFKGRNRYIVICTEFKLSTKPTFPKHDEISNFISSCKKMPSPSQIRKKVIKIRKAKSTIWNLKDPNTVGAGSFFSNPVITKKKFERLKRIHGEKIPAWEAPSNKVKISGGWLIEQAGFKKGYTKNNVGLSEKSAISVINKGGATSTEIRSFAQEIIKSVKDKFDIDLPIEIIYLGD